MYSSLFERLSRLYDAEEDVNRRRKMADILNCLFGVESNKPAPAMSSRQWALLQAMLAGERALADYWRE